MLPNPVSSKLGGCVVLEGMGVVLAVPYTGEEGVHDGGIGTGTGAVGDSSVSTSSTDSHS